MNEQKDSASEGVSEAAPERVKKVPLTSTWTCPKCNYQNVYREGVVSDPQNKCAACGTEVIVGAIRSTDDQPPEQNSDSGEMQTKASSLSQTAIPKDISLTVAEVWERRREQLPRTWQRRMARPIR